MEPRIVLNATAELNVLGQLVIMGDNAHDVVHVDVVNDTQLQLRNGVGDIIPISGHGTGVSGSEQDPIELSDIPAGELQIDLGDGDDLLMLQVPESLDITVIDSGGEDIVELSVQPATTGVSSDRIVVNADQIEFDAMGAAIGIGDRDVSLFGDVTVGDANTATRLDMGEGSFQVVGSLSIAGDITIDGNESTIDFSQAVLSARTPDSRLTLELSLLGGSSIDLGALDASAGHELADLMVTSTRDFGSSAPIQIADDFSVVASGQITISDAVTAGAIDLDSQQTISIDGPLASTSEGIVLTSSTLIELNGSLDTTESGIEGGLSVDAPEIRMSNMVRVHSGADIDLFGDVVIDETVTVSIAVPSQAVPSQVDFFGMIRGTNGNEDRLFIDAPGANVTFHDSVGRSVTANTINGLEIDAANVALDDVVIVNGNLEITANRTRLHSSSLIVAGTGSANFAGTVRIENDQLLTRVAGTARFESSVESDGSDWELFAGDGVEFLGNVSGLDDLAINTGGTFFSRSTVSIHNDFAVLAARGIELGGGATLVGGNLTWLDDVRFFSSTTIRSNQLRFDGDISVSNLQTVRLESQVSDSPGVTSWEKQGEGTLILVGDQAFQKESVIEEGTLTLAGTFGPNQGDFVVQADGILAGMASVDAAVRARGGVIAPRPDDGNATGATLEFSRVDLSPESTLAVDILGEQPGITHDVLASDGSIELNGALLSLPTIDVAPYTEIVLVQNDTSVNVRGRFRSQVDADGRQLAEPRILEDGAIVSRNFGELGQEAYITYFGGDGNDVTIVTAGDGIQQAGPVTLVERNGVNLEIRFGDSLADARAATPIIRPIAGLNGNTLRILGDGPRNEFHLDIDEFVDVSGQLNVDVDFVFSGTSQSDSDLVSVFDSNLSTDDTPETVVHTQRTDSQSFIRFQHPNSNRPDYSITTRSVEQFDHQLATETFQLRTTAADEIVMVTAGDTTGRIEIANETGDSTSRITTTNPTGLLSVFTGAGDDAFVLESIDSQFRSGISVITESGVDSIQIQDELRLGTATSPGNVRLDAERIDVNSPIRTREGGVDGEILLFGGDAISIVTSLDAGESAIVIDGNGGLIDAGRGRIASTDITFLDASDVTLGDVLADAGRLRLGTVQSPLGKAMQFERTSLVVDSLVGNVTGDLTLDELTNDFATVDGLIVGGDLELVDSVDDMRLAGIVARGNSTTVVTAGKVLLANHAVDATGGSIVMRATQGIDGAQRSDTRADLLADQIDLTVGTPFPEMPPQGTSNAGIGVANPVDLVAARIVNATTEATGGDIRLNSPSSTMPLGRLSSGAGRIELSGGTIEDAGDDSIADLFASDVVLSASNGIGETQRLEFQSVPLITATTDSGDIDLFIAATSVTTLRDISTHQGNITIDQSGEQRLLIQRVFNGDGPTSITNLDGSIEIGQSVSTDIVESARGGSMTISAQGDVSDILIRSTLRSVTGDITLSSDRDVIFTDEATIDSQDGVIAIVADQNGDAIAGSITMADGSVIDAGSGSVDAISGGDFSVALIRSNAFGSAITLESRLGRVVDSGDEDLDLVAANGTTTLVSSLGIGNGDELETELNTLVGDVSQAGSIEINDVSDVTLQRLATEDGLIRVTASGSIVASEVVSHNASALDGGVPNENRDITLVTTDVSSDILIDSVVAEQGADVNLISRDDILAVNQNSLLESDDLFLLARNSTGDQNDAIQLIVSINELEAAVTGDSRGDLSIIETDSLLLAASDRNDDTEMIRTSNGEIRVNAQRIQVVDTGVLEDDASLVSDREFFAGGENGRIRLQASQSMDLGDDVQLHADPIAFGSVQLTAPEVVLGNGFQIDTGNQVGVARIFAPRPDVEQLEMPIDEANPIVTSFFDFRSVTVNRLQQESINDATGVLSLDIGSQGERGLTINIDWGAPTARFQQIDGLSGDAPPLSVSHVYTEADILDSRLNDRPSGTAPLEVLFSVRHHESIVVTGDSIQQNVSDVETVDGRLISSTDNPLTAESQAVPILESGETRFIIPNLSIPVAFFPVRDVVPTAEKAEIIISTDTTVSQSQSAFEIAEATVTTSSGREEFFQLRVLSPDPEGDDLVEPKRLPDDILGGDRLSELFSQLPDGRYELQYVLGDGNVRSILQIDLRDGQPIIRGDDLDGGAMRLRPLDDLEENEVDEESDEPSDRDSANRNLPDEEPLGLEVEYRRLGLPDIDFSQEQNRSSGSRTIEGRQMVGPGHYQTPAAAMLSVKANQKLNAAARAESQPTVE